MYKMKINEELSVSQVCYPNGIGGGKTQIVASHGDVGIVLNGPSYEVDRLVQEIPLMDTTESPDKPIEVKRSYASEVQRVLVVLGFSESERGCGLKTFSRWVDHVQSLPSNSEELKATWAHLVSARFAGTEPPTTPSMVEEASIMAWHAIVAQLRYFPPRARMLDDPDASYTEEWTELCAWREAAKACGLDGPSDLASTAAMNFGQFVDKKATREWQDETGEMSPKLAGQRIASLVHDIHNQSQRIQSLLDERELWRERTNCDHLKEFVSTEKDWQDATHCRTPDEFRTNMAGWSKDTGCATPRMATLELDRLHAELGDAKDEIAAWQKETGCMTAIGAGERIADLKARVTELCSPMQANYVWQSATGRASPGEAQQRIEDLQMKLQMARSTLSERDQDLVMANAEIDRVKAAARVLGLVPDETKILNALRSENSALRADLQSKTREAQTERERANEELTRRVDMEKELLVRTEEWRNHVRRADEAEARLSAAIVPLPKPERVEVGQRWAVMTNVGYIYGSRTDDHAVDLSEFGSGSDKRMIASGNWIYLGK